MTIELLRELILIFAGCLFIFGGIRLACKKDSLSYTLIGYGAIPFAVDCVISKLYIYFLMWTAICYGAFYLLYKHTEAERKEFTQEFDTIVNKD